MKNNQLFDEHIKEQFNSYHPSVPSHIWENIIAEKERRKPLGFWFNIFNGKNILLMTGLLLTITTGALLITKYNSTDKNKNLENISSLKKKNHPNNIQTELPTGIANNFAAPVGNATEVLNSSTLQKTSLANAVTSFKIYNPGLQAETEETNPISKNYKKAIGLDDYTDVNNNPISLTDNQFTTTGTLLGRLTYNAQKYSLTKKYNNLLQLKMGPVKFLPDCPAIEKDAAGNKRYLEIYAGPDFAFRSISDTGNTTYLQKRKESTKFSSAYSAGIRYTKVFNNSMSVRAGLNYSQINEKFKFIQGNLIQVTYIIGPTGDTLGSYTTTGTRYKTTTNRLRSIDIPVVIGYEIGNGKWHTNINAGIVANVYSWQKGDVLDTAYMPISITTGKTSSPYQYKTNVGVGFIAGASVYYKINEQVHIMAEPYLRYNFAPMTKENFTLKQKYQTAGIRLGVRLDLK